MNSPSRSTFVWVLVTFLWTVGPALSQIAPRVTISGVVLDDSTLAPLENVNVFVAQTTLGCSTDNEGRFTIHNVPLGSYQIVASRVGYSVWSSRVTLGQSGRREFEIRLRASAVRIGEVVVSAADPAEWRKQLDRFQKLFLGRTRNAKRCRIINPEVLDFNEDGEAFSATARAPLEIENLALGYHIQFFLTLFKVKPEAGAIGSYEVLTYEGLPKYTELQGSTQEEKERWKENRLRTFKGSLRHFLISLVGGNWWKEGYVLNLLPHLRVQDRPIDRTRVTRETISEILTRQGSQGVKFLHFKGVLEVEYTRGLVEDTYDLLKKKGTDAQVSWLQLNYDAIAVNSSGLVTEWFPTVVHGYWAWGRVADALPLDYEPERD